MLRTLQSQWCVLNPSSPYLQAFLDIRKELPTNHTSTMVYQKKNYIYQKKNCIGMSMNCSVSDKMHHSKGFKDKMLQLWFLDNETTDIECDNCISWLGRIIGAPLPTLDQAILNAIYRKNGGPSSDRSPHVVAIMPAIYQSMNCLVLTAQTTLTNEIVNGQNFKNLSRKQGPKLVTLSLMTSIWHEPSSVDANNRNKTKRKGKNRKEMKKNNDECCKKIPMILDDLENPKNHVWCWTT